MLYIKQAFLIVRDQWVKTHL